VNLPEEKSRRWRLAPDIAGWYGAVAVLGAYALLTSDALSSNSSAYQGLNVSGALGLTWLAWSKGAWPAVVLNLIWAAIGLYGLFF
jgi:hypothetical protein